MNISPMSEPRSDGTSMLGAPVPLPSSAEERRRFAQLQGRLAPLLREVFRNSRASQTVVVIPSLSVDANEMAKIPGAHHYEERMLCMLMLLRHPHTHLIYITSQPISSTIIDYYLHLLPGIPLSHARRRLTLLSCHDGSSIPLSQKLLERPRLLSQVRAAIHDPLAAHMICFNSTSLERTLAVRLDIPLYACDPTLNHLGTKSGSREVFRQAGVAMPDGFERLRDEQDLMQALADLKRRQPRLRRAVIKLNDGFSGEGNALFTYDGAPTEGDLHRWIEAEFPNRVRFEAQSESWEHYQHKLSEMGGIVESFVKGVEKRSPSVQCRIDPLGNISIISTHDQVLVGALSEYGKLGTVCIGDSHASAERIYRDMVAVLDRVVRGEPMRTGKG